jgi:hypothetical protein
MIKKGLFKRRCIHRYFGKEIINNILNQSLNQNDSEGLDLIYKKLYNVR